MLRYSFWSERHTPTVSQWLYPWWPCVCLCVCVCVPVSKWELRLMAVIWPPIYHLLPSVMSCCNLSCHLRCSPSLLYPATQPPHTLWAPQGHAYRAGPGRDRWRTWVLPHAHSQQGARSDLIGDKFVACKSYQSHLLNWSWILLTKRCVCVSVSVYRHFTYVLICVQAYNTLF